MKGSVICVLENPKTIQNIAMIIRNVNAFGVDELYIVSQKMASRVSKKEQKTLKKVSVGSINSVTIRYFATTKDCFEYLKVKQYVSYVTSPHQKNKTNYNLYDNNMPLYPKLAIWFGSESDGISDEAVSHSEGCIQIPIRGVVESLNVAMATGIILSYLTK
jgi:tRNA (guanosine-2'-O-)-methyltransferase